MNRNFQGTKNSAQTITDKMNQKILSQKEKLNQEREDVFNALFEKRKQHYKHDKKKLAYIKAQQERRKKEKLMIIT